MTKSITIKEIRRAAVPLAGIETADPAATIKACMVALNGNGESIPIVCWDIGDGLKGLNTQGTQAIGWYDAAAMPLPDILKGMANCPRGTLGFFCNVHRFFDRDGVAQGLWNLRDVFKAAGSTIVIIGPTVKLPPELQSDVVIITEPAPDREVVSGVVDKIMDSASKAGADVKGADKAAVIGSLLGLASAFDIEQTLSLSISKTGIDIDSCWKRKIGRLKAQAGLDVSIDNPDFSKLAGCAAIKSELIDYIKGRQPPGVVLYLDEPDKMFQGSATDSSGVTGKMLAQFLTWAQESDARGFLFAGIPGSGKSWTARCAAGEGGVPCARLSIGETQDSLVGQSEANMKQALSSIDAISGGRGRVLMIGACNWVDSLPPEFISRFTMGTYFYDYPDEESELPALWRQYLKQYDLKDKLPSTPGWVGREVKAACDKAWLYNKPVSEVIARIVPSAQSQKQKLDKLRESVSGRFLSSSYAGPFHAKRETAEAGGRSFKL